MISWLKRCALEAEDRLRYSRRVRGWLGDYKRLRASRASASDSQGRVRILRALCDAARLANDGQTVRSIMDRIHEHLHGLDLKSIDWSEFALDDSRRIERAAILKPFVGEREKGVLFIAFESEWFKLLLHGQAEAVARRYTLILAPSSSPHNLVSYVFPAAVPDPIFTLISHAEEQELLPRIAPKFLVVPLYASSWVNPDLFAPRPRDRRDVDLVMVASFGKVKRHHALFRALRTMPRYLRILLIGQDQEGRTGDTILEMARCYGVADRFTLLCNASWPTVAEALCRARASVILSRREGSCVVVAESLFADTPVALLRDADIGSKAFINPETGRLLDHADLGGQLTRFLAASDRCAARRWAEANTGCFHSSALLNQAGKGHMLAAGQEWTRDLAPLCWRPDPYLVRSEDRRMMSQERDDFQARFGLDVGPVHLD